MLRKRKKEEGDYNEILDYYIIIASLYCIWILGVINY